MKTTSLFVLCIGCVFVAMIAQIPSGLSAAAQGKNDKPDKVAAPSQKWEYKIHSGRLDEVELNKLGDDGWELVGIGSDVTGGRVKEGSGGGVSTKTQFYFKRPKK